MRLFGCLAFNISESFVVGVVILSRFSSLLFHRALIADITPCKVRKFVLILKRSVKSSKPDRKRVESFIKWPTLL